MGGWVDGWMGGWVDGWMSGWADLNLLLLPAKCEFTPSFRGALFSFPPESPAPAEQCMMRIAASGINTKLKAAHNSHPATPFYSYTHSRIDSSIPSIQDKTVQTMYRQEMLVVLLTNRKD